MASADNVIENTDVHTVEWDDEIGVPVFTWNTYVSGEEFQEHARRWEEVIKQRGAEKYLVNTEAVTAHDDADKGGSRKRGSPTSSTMGSPVALECTTTPRLPAWTWKRSKSS